MGSDPYRIERTIANLVRWYAVHARDLPWRPGSPSQRALQARSGASGTDPYVILVSEVMLQQTQVARVVPRFEAWIERWPSADALAAAPLADVLRAWIGLGYNRRAVRLREAAAVVARDGWPEDLRALPGVGAYTAAAVGSFAFDRDELAIDTNARRVFARWGFAPARGSAEVNQAVMELGATVCRAREARCSICPATACASRGVPLMPAPRAPSGTRERFEDSDRFARGRVLAALAGAEPWPAALEEERLARAVRTLAADGLVVVDAAGPRLP